ncbi:hypothetical protein [Asticcacaulis sp. AC402]|uniref:hypothetical protein n=1 Tax=Asticcacaulis sp. AC402 TaxID=1282361 RepID=UPI0003C3C7BB|nr:hypothetical protein [Asticcacaulis sp. AC402]ESQ75714.1 hypothetical protein ABAC402_07050 [Asticcacaulis sp. AC402]
MNPKIIAIAGGVAAFLAVVFNLAPPTDPAGARTMAIASVVAGVIAIASAVYCVRKGGTWRWIGIGIGGPALFAMADASVRLILYVR